MHRQFGNAKRDYKAFRVELAEKLIGGYSGRVLHKGRPAIDDDQRLNLSLGHLPIFRDDKRTCKLCSKRGMTTQTRIRCERCGVHLCVARDKDCFKEYHILSSCR